VTFPITDALSPCNAMPRAGFPYLRAMRRGAKNAGKIPPPQPTVSTTSTSSFLLSLLSQAIWSVFSFLFS
jgi:hypothetical protein